MNNGFHYIDTLGIGNIFFKEVFTYRILQRIINFSSFSPFGHVSLYSFAADCRRNQISISREKVITEKRKDGSETNPRRFNSFKIAP